MSLLIFYRPEASDDIDTFYGDYEKQLLGLGDRLMEALRVTLDRIAATPELYVDTPIMMWGAYAQKNRTNRAGVAHKRNRIAAARPHPARFADSADRQTPCTRSQGLRVL